MKLPLFFAATVLFLSSCASYTDEQGKAADDFCECMDKDGDFDILYYECEVANLEKYSPETFADEGWALALEEKCPAVAGKIADGD